MLLAVAPDGELEPFRERVDDADADAVEAARDLVGIVVGGVLELPAGVELGHDDLGRRDAFLGMDSGRDAAAIVLDRDRAVGVQLDEDPVAMAGKRLVDRIVRDLEHHVVEARAVVGVADVHAGALAHRVEALEDLDAFGVIDALVRGIAVGVGCHSPDIGIYGRKSRARARARTRESLVGSLLSWRLNARARVVLSCIRCRTEKSGRSAPAPPPNRRWPWNLRLGWPPSGRRAGRCSDAEPRDRPPAGRTGRCGRGHPRGAAANDRRGAGRCDPAWPNDGRHGRRRDADGAAGRRCGCSRRWPSWRRSALVEGRWKRWLRSGSALGAGFSRLNASAAAMKSAGSGVTSDLLARGALDVAQIAALVGRAEGDGDAVGAGARGAADAVDILLGNVGQVEVDDVADARDVDPARGDVGRDQHPHVARLERGDRALALRLALVAVDRAGRDAGRFEQADDLVGAMLGAAEDQRALDRDRA